MKHSTFSLYIVALGAGLSGALFIPTLSLFLAGELNVSAWKIGAFYSVNALGCHLAAWRAAGKRCSCKATGPAAAGAQPLLPDVCHLAGMELQRTLSDCVSFASGRAANLVCRLEWRAFWPRCRAGNTDHAAQRRHAQTLG
ncbi:hypothetical protein [Pantoea sp. CTOTU46764]|uniref:hypothetical protein n=1 Tax=Pantoea sp. CTOTU46764 TaxID=2953854 RepID=UPI00289D189C|nr:hypothetical protein [Pantoea sp. CTOTU46764]